MFFYIYQSDNCSNMQKKDINRFIKRLHNATSASGPGKLQKKEEEEKSLKIFHQMKVSTFETWKCIVKFAGKIRAEAAKNSKTYVTN